MSSFAASGRKGGAFVTTFWWIIASPILFVLPGLWPAQVVTGSTLCARTLGWAVFFSVVLLPPVAFGVAMIVGTVMGAHVLIPLGLAMGAPGVVAIARRGRA
ncbi:MAG: hypothetical protein KJ042_08125 [Deltaproteobacteria bacterium]|nr:hypothetical protein [Deltaproteobacteria bacterium]